MENEYIIEMLNITKALLHQGERQHYVTAQKGEIHALFGENGAGKINPDEYSFWSVSAYLRNHQEEWAGSPYQHAERRQRSQHRYGAPALCFRSNVSVLDNIILGVEPTKGLFLEKACPCKSHGAEREIRSDGRSGRLISDITVVHAAVSTEILKMLYRDNEVLIFDEPTGVVLTPQEIDELMKIMKNLAKEGKSILFITHKLNEIMEVADRCTILRKGKYIGTVNISETSKKSFRMMVGRNVSFSVNKKPSKLGDTVLKVEQYDRTEQGARKQRR